MNTTNPEQPTPAVPYITLNDLAAVVQMIDIVSRRGAFEGQELVTVGALRNRFAEFVKVSTPKVGEVPTPKVEPLTKLEEESGQVLLPIGS